MRAFGSLCKASVQTTQIMAVKQSTFLFILLQQIYNTKTLYVTVQQTLSSSRGIRQCYWSCRIIFCQITRLQSQLAALKADLDAKEEADNRKEAE